MRYIRHLWFMFVGLCVSVTLYNLRSYVNFIADSALVQVWKSNEDLLSNRHENSSNETHQSRYIQKGNPVHHIAFLKIHKAASATVANIFQRYGYEKNLVFALPRGRGGGGPSLTPRYFFPPPKNGTFDIVCGHVRYNREQFRRVLPNNTIYIGIVREPFSQFQSYIRFFRPTNVLNTTRKNPVLEYLSHNETQMEFRDYTNLRYHILNVHEFNMMANEFGFPEEILVNRDQNKIQSYLRKLDKEMDIVLVTEYLDESIVLMRRLLKWDLKYVLHGSIHVNKLKDPRLQFGSKEENLYKVKSYLDYALYDFFVHKFKETLKRQPPDFYDELAYFRKTRIKYDTFCLSTRLDNKTNTEMLFEDSEWNMPFVLSKEHCEKLYLEGVKFFNLMIREQGLKKGIL